MRENNEYIDFNNIETALNNLSYSNWVTGTAVDFMAYSNIFLRILHLSWQNTAMSIVTQYHFSLSVDLSHFHPKVARHTRKAIWKRTPGNMRNRSHIGGVARHMCHVRSACDATPLLCEKFYVLPDVRFQRTCHVRRATLMWKRPTRDIFLAEMLPPSVCHEQVRIERFHRPLQ